MESLYLLIPLGIVTVAVFAWIFVAAAMDGQFEDLDSQQDSPPDED